ncbi:hypothetical protein Tsubulata_013994, partial [Turnera subulata]
DTNFWGFVNCSRFAVPHLKKSRGRIIASKAALTALCEAMAVEIGPDVGITIVNPGVVTSEMTGGDFLITIICPELVEWTTHFLREDLLREVANKAWTLGSPDVIVVGADVSKSEDCERLIDETIRSRVSMASLDINFRGTVETTHHAVPHLRRSEGRIIVISSILAWYPAPNLSFYNASETALTAFFETLSVEFGSDIGVTIASPGTTDTEMTKGNTLEEADFVSPPMIPTEVCAKSIVSSACRGDRYLTIPFWTRTLYLGQLICPEFMNWYSHRKRAAKIKKIT